MMKGKAPTMARFALAPGEVLVACPYERSHQVTQNKMMTHLGKCRRNHEIACEKKGESVLMVGCKYDHTHQVPSPELLRHEQNCADQYNIVQHLIENLDTENGGALYNLYLTREADPVDPNDLVRKSKKKEPEPEQVPTESIETTTTTTTSTSDKAKPRLRACATDMDEDEDWEKESASRGPVESYNPAIKVENEVMLKYPPGLTKSERKEWKQKMIEKAKTHGIAGLPIVSVEIGVDGKENTYLRDYQVDPAVPRPNERRLVHIDEDDDEELEQRVSTAVISEEENERYGYAEPWAAQAEIARRAAYNFIM